MAHNLGYQECVHVTDLDTQCAHCLRDVQKSMLSMVPMVALAKFIVGAS